MIIHNNFNIKIRLFFREITSMFSAIVKCSLLNPFFRFTPSTLYWIEINIDLSRVYFYFCREFKIATWMQFTKKAYLKLTNSDIKFGKNFRAIIFFLFKPTHIIKYTNKKYLTAQPFGYLTFEKLTRYP